MTAEQLREKRSALYLFLARSMPLVATLMVGILSGILWGPWNEAAVWVLIATAIATVLHSVWGMINNVKKGHVGVDVLAVVALMSTLVVHEYWASWIVVVMIFSGEAIEDYAEARAQQNLAALVEAAPSEAHRLQVENDGSETWVTIPVDEVQISDVLMVKPGETVPVNGILQSPLATLDLSMINGEPLPVDVYEGSKVSSGAINGASPMTVKATAVSADSQYQKIIELVQSAQQSRSAAVKTADMLAVPFTVISFAIAFIAWAASGNPLRFAEVLVIATPCPLLIAAPVAFMGGTGRLAKAGVVIKAQDILEDLGNVTHVFFDKTGTLTNKKAQVDRVELSTWASRSNFSNEQVLIFAGVLEGYSSHILARGVENAAVQLLTQRMERRPEVVDASESTGNGVEGEIAGYRVKVGRLSYVVNGVAEGDIAQEYPKTADNEMVTYISIDNNLAGRIVLKDFARDNAASTVQWLKKLGVSSITMLTGDKAQSANIIAQTVGISDVRAELLPEDKVSAVRQVHAKNVNAAASGEQTSLSVGERFGLWVKRLVGLRSGGAVSMMVGDGVNDAPVLAVSDIGTAMTDGSSTAASESAQVVIMNDDIAMVPKAVVISRQTKRVMVQAVYGGLLAAIVCMVLAGFGLIPAIWGAILQELIDVASILWALTAIINRKVE